MKEYKKSKQIDFMNFLFGDKETHEFITIFGIHKADTANTTTKHFLSIDEALEHANKIKLYYNVYVNLSTTNGEGRASEHNISRNTIAFDFDKKDLGTDFNHKDIVNLFKKNGIYFHMLIDSGGGYHVYLKTERTNDIDNIVNVNKNMAILLQADTNATKQTQVLRIPYTYNHKSERPKEVKIITLSNKIINYSINELSKKFACVKTRDKNIYEVLNTKNNYFCINTVLQNGVEEGNRIFQLHRLVSFFKTKNYSNAKIKTIIEEWNQKCKPPLDEKTLKYQLNYSLEHDIKYWGCKSNDSTIQQQISQYCNQYECSKGDKSELVCHSLKTIKYEYKIMEKTKKILTGNHLAVIGLLKNQPQGLTDQQLETELTSVINGKIAICKSTRAKIYKDLYSTRLIKIEKGQGALPNLYKLNDIRCLEKEKIFISFFALQRFIDGAVGQAAFKLYCYMFYRLSRGLNVVQSEIASDLMISQQSVSQLIIELEKAKFLNSHLDYSRCKYGAKIYEWCV